jgi:gliding motility-associated-like protein
MRTLNCFLIRPVRLFLLFVLLSQVGISQDFSNKGKDFWLGYGNHVAMFGNNAQRMSIYITGDEATTGVVEIPGLLVNIPFTVVPKQITEVSIPQAAALAGEGLTNLGIHVTSIRPIVVYGHIYNQSVSGASLILPTPTLGQEYYSVNYTQRSNQTNSYSFFFVVATEDNTVIEVKLSSATINGLASNVIHRINLSKGQVYQFLSSTDLTGSEIRSVNNGSGCKKIAVFCGSGKIAIGCSGNPGSSDNLFQQMYPTSTWGKTFITVPSKERSLNYYRIVKKSVGSVVKLNGTVLSPAAFQNDFFYEFSTSEPTFIESDQPILVAQYFTTQSNCGIEQSVPGDPEMIFLNPIEQTLRSVTLNSSPRFNILSHFINIVVKNSGTALSSFLLDGNPVGAGAFTPLPSAPGYVYAQLSVSAGTHNLSCDSGFNALAYGFGSAESYGYSAGTNLVDLYQFITVKNPMATINAPATCRNTPFDLSFTFPYIPMSITWDFGNLRSSVKINNPSPDSSFLRDGRTLYVFKLKETMLVQQVGTYPIKVLAENPSADGCAGLQELEYDLEVYETPKAAIQLDADKCLGQEVAFVDQTNGFGRSILGWNWLVEEGGNGYSYAEKSGKHLFQNAGQFSVQFFAFNETGCFSDTLLQTVAINPLPVPAFDVISPSCVDNQIVFKNDFSIPQGAIQSITWEMGDGQIIQQTGAQFLHQYSSSGTKIIKATGLSNKGCSSLPFTKTIEVHSNPVASFIAPQICLDDAIATFQNISFVPGQSAAALQYNWSFDGGNPLTTNAKNPAITYSAAGNYTVSLKVASTHGCTDDSTLTFTVNGSVPKSDFSLSTPALCVADSIELTDASSVDFGKIIKVEIYWDYTNNPTLKTVDEAPAPGKKWFHFYAPLQNITSRTVTVLYVVYSGVDCVSQLSKTFELKPSPILSAQKIPPVCAEGEPVMLTFGAELSGLPGMGQYSLLNGASFSSANELFPNRLGAGQHPIQYHFLGSNGCNASITETIVIHPTPQVQAGPDMFLLEGGTLKLGGSGRGNQVSYEWSPTAFLKDPTDPQTEVSNALQDMVYRLTATSGFGCTSSDEMKLTVLKTPEIPNIFTPNGDGINDNWVIQYLNTYPDCKIQVYNRYGQPVFSSKGYSTPWNGTYQGSKLPTGTYYYVIEPGNGRKPLKGNVTIIY